MSFENTQKIHKHNILFLLKTQIFDFKDSSVDGTGGQPLLFTFVSSHSMFQSEETRISASTFYSVLGYLLGSCGWPMERMMRCLSLSCFIIIYIAFKNMSGTGREMLSL